MLFATIKLAVHVAANLWEAHIGYGYFRDEFYYIACGRHLAWGYVDHGPIVAVQARISELVFGRSLAGLRFLSALAGAARVFLTGMLAWALGGRRPAQGLAMLGVLLVPQYLGTDSFLSMNSFESLFWMTCLLALVLMLKNEAHPGSQKLWLLFGVSGGIGVLNKPSMTFFLVALLLALLLTPQRRLLASRWAAAGIAVLVLIALPNLLWQMHNHWPTLEFLRNGQIGNKTIKLSPGCVYGEADTQYGSVSGIPLDTGARARFAAKRREMDRHHIRALLPYHDGDACEGLLRFANFIQYCLRRVASPGRQGWPIAAGCAKTVPTRFPFTRRR